MSSHQPGGTEQTSYTDAELISAIRTVADTWGDDSLSKSEYVETQAKLGEVLPTHQTISRRLGWTEACERAGVEPATPGYDRH